MTTIMWRVGVSSGGRVAGRRRRRSLLQMFGNGVAHDSTAGQGAEFEEGARDDVLVEIGELAGKVGAFFAGADVARRVCIEELPGGFQVLGRVRLIDPEHGADDAPGVEESGIDHQELVVLLRDEVTECGVDADLERTRIVSIRHRRKQRVAPAPAERGFPGGQTARWHTGPAPADRALSNPSPRRPPARPHPTAAAAPASGPPPGRRGSSLNPLDRPPRARRHRLEIRTEKTVATNDHAPHTVRTIRHRAVPTRSARHAQCDISSAWTRRELAPDFAGTTGGPGDQLLSTALLHAVKSRSATTPEHSRARRRSGRLRGRPHAPGRLLRRNPPRRRAFHRSVTGKIMSRRAVHAHPMPTHFGVRVVGKSAFEFGSLDVEVGDVAREPAQMAQPAVSDHGSRG